VSATVHKPFIFLDRDGTLIVEKHYLADPAGVELCNGVVEGLLRLQSAGYRLVVVSNQSGIGRGILTEDQVRAVNTRMADLLAKEGISLAGVYWCPHGPNDLCSCRKPAPGMIHRAVAELGGDLRGACVIGDREADIGLASAAGLSSILVRTGYGCETEFRMLAPPSAVCDTIDSAASWFLGCRLSPQNEN
jgi:histidinol-phosphate phosphatase family protein